MTIILFAEIAKRSYTELKQQEIFLLYYMAGAAMASPFQGLLWSQYLVQSDAAKMLGLTEFIPDWVAPGPGSESLVLRTFFPPGLADTNPASGRHPDHPAVDHFGLGYTLYRITSDVEKLPFPMAPVGALGTMALAESTEDKKKKLEMAGIFHRRGHRPDLWQRVRPPARGLRDWSCQNPFASFRYPGWS